MNLKQVIEGKTKLFVPELHDDVPEHGEVFYNPKMSFDRTLSLKIVQDFFKEKKAEKIKLLDLFSGLGARAVRYANELDMDLDVYANDIQPTAVKLVEKNAALNNVKVKASCMEANEFLVTQRKENFDCIDIDPFGSPAKFLFNALLAVKPRDSLLCVTATDIGSLAGAYPKAGWRKYGAWVVKTSFMHEAGVRALLGFVAKEAAKLNYAIKPYFSYHKLHYYRVFVEVFSGRKTVNRETKKIGYYEYCPKCERRKPVTLSETFSVKCECGGEFIQIGPLWLGELGVKDYFFTGENEILIPYYDLVALGKIFKTQKKKKKVIEELTKKGYKTTETHFSPTGIKTNAPYEEIIKIFKGA